MVNHRGVDSRELVYFENDSQAYQFIVGASVLGGRDFWLFGINLWIVGVAGSGIAVLDSCNGHQIRLFFL